MILYLTNADTELLALRAVAEGLPEDFPALRAANPNRLHGPVELEGVEAVLVRLLGGRRSWQEPFDALVAACSERGVPLLCFSGEAVLDAEMVAASSVPGATVAQAFEYLVQGGLDNLEQLLRFVADTVLMGGFGFQPPRVLPDEGIFGERSWVQGRPTVAVVFYRAHVVAHNTRFVDELCGALEREGANALALYCYSLRPAQPGGLAPAVAMLKEAGVDVVVTTVLAAGSLGEGEDWDPGALASLDVPVIQAVCATTSAAHWAQSARGLAPLDVAMAVAIPEFDGRIVGPAFSFKEQVDDALELGVEITAYRTLADRLRRLARLAVGHARLRQIPIAHRKVAVVLSAYPTKRSRLGNAVGLDTPASALVLLEAMADAGYGVSKVPASGDELMATLADGLTYRSDGLGADPVEALGSWPASAYEASLEREAGAEGRSTMEATWGEAPGEVGIGGGSFFFCGLDLGQVVVAVQPPRGFGENPVAVYHSPDLPPTHHYVAFYRWLEDGFGAHAVVHLGKHGTLEWLPGKSVGLSQSCFPDLAEGSVPLVYPFVVNDPGEGTQAKRRAHAIIVDHLVPPLTRAESYDELARLESLLDSHAQLAALDPSKLPEIRRQVWEVLVEAEIHRDLDLDRRRPSFDDDGFDDLLVEVDGYLCELKDAQIRGGLHVLGQPPQGQAEVDLLLALTRLPQGHVPSLRQEVATELGIDLDHGDRRLLDQVEEECRRRLGACQVAGFDHRGVAVAHPELAQSKTLSWVCERLAPALRATKREVGAVLGALDGRFVQPGPSGAPSRGMAHVLPTGRNFYAVDPKAIPSPLAWQVGRRLAEALVDRHRAEEGAVPRSVALVVWGTAAMRTGGDDIAQALALLGIRPVWETENGRVRGLELLSTEELGRPRVDVTLRISGFFRDAFPHVLDLVDQAVAMAAGAEDPVANAVAEGGQGPRVFGPKPGAYGSGILEVLESGSWHDEADLAAVYLAWGGFAYGRGAEGRPAVDELRQRLAGVEVAIKNQDNREHDIFDSDDYLQDHGGMVATIRALTGRQPKAFFGDSADPGRPRVRPLAEEAARVVRSRVLNPKWLAAMQRHGYKGAFEMAATVDYLYGYDATAGVVEDWMYERVTKAYVADPETRAFFAASNPWALGSIAERLLEAADRGLWNASEEARRHLEQALLEAEGLEEDR